MQAVRRKIIVDKRGNPSEVIISWRQFCEMSEALGLDLDEKAKSDLRAATSKAVMPEHSNRSRRSESNGETGRSQSGPRDISKEWMREPRVS